MGKAIRLGNTFTLAEVIHQMRILDAVAAGDVRAAQKLAMDPIGIHLRMKFQNMRAVGQARAAGGTGRKRTYSADPKLVKHRALTAARRAVRSAERAQEAAAAAGVAGPAISISLLEEPFHAK